MCLYAGAQYINYLTFFFLGEYLKFMVTRFQTHEQEFINKQNSFSTRQFPYLVSEGEITCTDLQNLNLKGVPSKHDPGPERVQFLLETLKVAFSYKQGTALDEALPYYSMTIFKLKC